MFRLFDLYFQFHMQLNTWLSNARVRLWRQPLCALALASPPTSPPVDSFADEVIPTNWPTLGESIRQHTVLGIGCGDFKPQDATERRSRP